MILFFKKIFFMDQYTSSSEDTYSGKSFRQTGHCFFFCSHSRIQSLWNLCLQGVLKKLLSKVSFCVGWWLILVKQITHSKSLRRLSLSCWVTRLLTWPSRRGVSKLSLLLAASSSNCWFQMWLSFQLCWGNFCSRVLGMKNLGLYCCNFRITS